MYVQVCVYAHTRTQIHTHTYTHTQTHMQTYTHTHICIYTHAYTHLSYHYLKILEAMFSIPSDNLDSFINTASTSMRVVGGGSG